LIALELLVCPESARGVRINQKDLPEDLMLVGLNESVAGPEDATMQLDDELIDTGFALPLLGSEGPGVHNEHKPMLWVHISKAAGSLVCGLAAKNGERIVHPNNNCNWGHVDTHFLKGQGPKHASCEERTGYFYGGVRSEDNQSYTWGHIERELNFQDLCPWVFDYGVMLRDPVDLAISFLRYGRFTQKELDLCLDCAVSKGFGASCYELPYREHFLTFRWGMLYYWDNPLVRYLGGVQVFGLPLGAVTAEHTQLVIDRLNSTFRVVMLWEDIGRPEVWKDALGWDHPPRKLINPSPGDIKLALSDEQREQATKLSEQDLSLIKYFKQVAYGDRIKPRTERP